MLKNKKEYIINIILTLISLLLLVLLHIFVYKGLGSSFSFIILGSWLTINIIHLFDKNIVKEKYLYIMGISILIVSITIYILNLPAVSYPKAIDIAIDYGLTDLKEPPFEVIFANKLPKNKRITESYMFVGKYKDKDVYLMVSPIDGSIQVENIGDSYIDRALQLIEEKEKEKDNK